MEPLTRGYTHALPRVMHEMGVPMIRWLSCRLWCVVLVVGVTLPPSVAGQARNPDRWTIPEGWRGMPGPPLAKAPDVPGPIQFTEPEFPMGAMVNGLTITTLNGAPIGAPTAFSYTVGGSPSSDSTIAAGPPPQMFVNPPGIEGGTVGELGANFGQDVDRVGFGWAMNCGQIPAPSVTVTLLDSGGGTVATATVPGSFTGHPFAEGQVFMDPASLFRSMRVTFTNPGGCDRFFVDNLGYPPLVTPVEGLGFTVE